MTVVNPGGGASSAVIIGANQGTAASRPAAAAAAAGQIFWATDTGEISINNLTQTAWQTLAQTSNAGGFTGVNGLLSGAGANVTVANGGLLHFVSNNQNISTNASGITAAGVDVTTGGGGLRVSEAANGKQGTFTANGTTNVVVANTSVTANSRILMSLNTISGTPGVIGVVSRIAGTSFTVVSTAATDLGTYAFEIFEPG